MSAADTPEEQRVIIDEMLQVFYDDGPWLHMYFQPDFYGVSNRVELRRPAGREGLSLRDRPELT
jgi:hypothetical protein